MTITSAELRVIVERLLSEGVPSTVVARSFDLDTDVVREALSGVRARQYGTDDIAEYVEQMQWDAVARAREVIASGGPEATRFVSSILGKQMTQVQKRTPEGQRARTEAVLDALARARDGAGSPVEPSRFVAVQVDDEDEDDAEP